MSLIWLLTCLWMGIASVCCFILPELPLAADHEYIVETSQGKVKGSSDGTVAKYLGIPFAQPPLGPLRWKAPQPPLPWQSVRDATQFSPACMQGPCVPALVCPDTFSEDCLYLNIFTPSSATNGSDLPVMFFIHGGNFVVMSGSSPLFDGEMLVRKGNVVLVTINYRLGALGFMVTGNKVDDATGNYGILDQIQALKWVSQNIRYFGGDPNKVTLFGQSAGAQSVLQHITSDESSTYFRNGIVSSPPVSVPYKTYDEAITLSGFLADDLGCRTGDMSCLRAKSAYSIARATQNTGSMVPADKYLQIFENYGPYIDGSVVKGQPLDVFSEGTFSKKPLILGVTTEEAVLYVFQALEEPVKWLRMITLVATVHPSGAAQIMAKYPIHGLDSDERETVVSMCTDLIFLCSNRNLTRTVLDQGNDKVWFYIWDHAFDFKGGWGSLTYCEDRVCHGSEIPYVFGTAHKKNFNFTQQEQALSDNVITYWTNFAWTGDPNNGGDKFRSGDAPTSLLTWPKTRSHGPLQAMSFQTPKSSVIQDYRKDYCDFWDSVGYNGYV